MDRPWGWARIWVAAKRDSQTVQVRQGAWYPVLSTGATRIVLALPGSDESLAVPKDAFEIRNQRPERFTVVYRTTHETNPARGTTADMGQTYAVCPKCASRVRLGLVPPPHTHCGKCGHEGDVAWWETG
jgi:hypothetical protein